MDEKKILILTTEDRIQGIGTLFLAEADKEILLLQRAIREKTELSKDEEKQIGLEPVLNDNGRTVGFKWDDENEKPFEPNFSIKELSFLDDRATALDKSKKLRDSNLDLAFKIWEAVK